MTDRRKFIKSTSLLIAASATVGYQVTYAKNKLMPKNSKDNNNMLYHNVYFWLKEGVTESEKEDFEKGLDVFLSSIKEIKNYNIGIPAGTPDREVVDKSFGYSILVSFKNVADHNEYQKHPAHEVFINDFSALWEKVQVYDSEMI